MKLLELETEFKYKGDRKYIHSTTICDFIARSWSDFSRDDLMNLSISIDIHEEAKNNGKLVYFDEKQSIKEIGAISESKILLDGNVVCYCYFIEQQSSPSKEDSPAYDLSNFELVSDYSGSCVVGVDSPIKLLENVVEANKKIHLNTLKDNNYDVLNIYMKNFPFSILKLGGRQRLFVENKRKRFQHDGFSTINEFWFDNEPAIKFQISFYLRKRN
jgi:hypothetical protein